MNEIVKKNVLAGDKFMPEITLKKVGFTYTFGGPVTENKKAIQTLRKHETPGISRGTNWIKLAFNPIWLLMISRICLEE